MMSTDLEKNIYDQFTKTNFYIDGIVDLMYKGDKKDEKSKEEYRQHIKDTIYQDTAQKIVFDVYQETVAKVASFTGIPIYNLDIRNNNNKFNQTQITALDKTGQAKLDTLKKKVENASPNPHFKEQ